MGYGLLPSQEHHHPHLHVGQLHEAGIVVNFDFSLYALKKIIQMCMRYECTDGPLVGTHEFIVTFSDCIKGATEETVTLYITAPEAGEDHQARRATLGDLLSLTLPQQTVAVRKVSQSI